MEGENCISIKRVLLIYELYYYVLDHPWGEGQRLMGLVWDSDNLPHHHENPTQLAGASTFPYFNIKYT